MPIQDLQFCSGVALHFLTVSCYIFLRLYCPNEPTVQNLRKHKLFLSSLQASVSAQLINLEILTRRSWLRFTEAPANKNSSFSPVEYEWNTASFIFICRFAMCRVVFIISLSFFSFFYEYVGSSVCSISFLFVRHYPCLASHCCIHLVVEKRYLTGMNSVLHGFKRNEIRCWQLKN